jgi:cystathionine gamma-synthase
MHNVLGGVIDPHAASLLLRGMKTLGLRVAAQNCSAMEARTAPQGSPFMSGYG